MIFPFRQKKLEEIDSWPASQKNRNTNASELLLLHWLFHC
jgi:hypothetical protein